MSGPRRGLGRGLGALIPTSAPSDGRDSPVSTFLLRGSGVDHHDPGTHDVGRPEAAGVDQDDDASPVNASTSNATGAGYFAELPIESVIPNERQPRQVFDGDALAELVSSIQQVGLLQPVVVRPLDDGRFELVMGERRWRAAQQAGLSVIPAIVRQTADNDMLRDALLENLHRAELNPLEEAAAYGQLLDDFGCTHDELAQRIGRSRPQISNTLRLLRLPAAVQRRVAAGVLSAGHARALLGVEDPAAAERLALRVVAEGLSVRALEEIVMTGAAENAAEPKRRTRIQAEPALIDLSERLSEQFETRVKVEMGRHKGKVTIEFGSSEDLDRIVSMLGRREH
jgi:ParB family chromosome partitioning protein